MSALEFRNEVRRERRREGGGCWSGGKPLSKVEEKKIDEAVEI